MGRIVKILKNHFFLLIISAQTSCMLSDNPFNAFDTLEPVNINDGSIISTPIVENINSIALEGIFADLHNNQELWQMRSLLVFRNDRFSSRDLSER